MSTDSTISFIGGITSTTGASDNNGGSGLFEINSLACSDPPTQTDLARYMAADGTALYTVTGATYANATGVISKASSFATNLTGLYVHVEEDASSGFTEDWFEISASDANSITITSGLEAGDKTVKCWVGGGLATLTAAVGNGVSSAVSPATTTQWRDIWINIDQDLSAIAQGKVTWGVTGDLSHNNKVRAIGFYQTPGDMSEGGAYYGGAWHAEWATAGKKWVDVDGGGALADDLIDLRSAVEGLEFHNLYFHGTDEANANNLFELDSSSVAMVWVNCKFDGGYYSIYFNGCCHALINCWFGEAWGSNTTLIFIVTPCFVIDCVINIAAGGIGTYGGGNCLFINTIFIGGSYGIRNVYGAMITVANCTFYNCTVVGIRIDNATAVLVEANNIFMPAAAADFAVNLAGTNDGTVLYSDHSVAYTVSGAAFGTHAWYDSGNSRDIQGYQSQEDVNPSFEDAVNSDFDVLNVALWSAGITVGGNPTLPGAVPHPNVNLYLIYRAAHGSTIDYDDPIGWMPDGATSVFVVDQALDGEIWNYTRVAIGSCAARSDPSEIAIVEVDGGGDLFGPIGNQVNHLRLTPLADAKFRINWLYDPVDQPATPTGFKVYRKIPTGLYTLQDSAVLYKDGRNKYSLTTASSLDNGQEYYFQVRTYKGADELSTIDYVSGIADDTGPPAVELLTVTDD